MFEAKISFSKIDFQDDIDYNTYPKSIYRCPICTNELSFNKQDFEKYSLNEKSIFSYQEQYKIQEFQQKRNNKESNSFIDFYCPKCNLPTRIYYTAWGGGRFTGGYHLDFVIIDDELS